MKSLFSIFIFLTGLHYSSSAKNFGDKRLLQQIISDTTLKSSEAEDKTIEEILKSRDLPKKETIEYLSQETKFGFKNLFKNYSYNSTMPYSSQVNPYAETYMQDYLQAHGSFLQKMKNTAILKFNFIDNILAQYGIPKELKYLAVIESNLNSNATSWVGARGPWQFMSYTAKEYGLRVNNFMDERTDYTKSTNAAARYLLTLYKDLKDWLLVIAAYNGGPGRVYSAIRQSGSRNFWALQYYLPTESRNHVKKFIATHFIMEANDNSSGNMDYTTLKAGNNIKSNISQGEAENNKVLSISGRYNSIIIAKNLSMAITEFNRLNPNFDNAMSAGEKFDLRLPSDKMDFFLANKYLILNECVHVLLTSVNAEIKTVFADKKIGKKKN
ncbi:MAG TPA: lytic transglycosylase domain-containing protein [Chitinophagaceae bacterium]|nr:lytic transglycosylase domain-containing protein [Chitinophagaceae bacterium]